jgi:hypothetical protein
MESISLKLAPEHYLLYSRNCTDTIGTVTEHGRNHLGKDSPTMGKRPENMSDRHLYHLYQPNDRDSSGLQ